MSDELPGCSWARQDLKGAVDDTPNRTRATVACTVRQEPGLQRERERNMVRSERGERLQITDQDGLECRLSPQISGIHTDFEGKQTYITILTITGPQAIALREPGGCQHMRISEVVVSLYAVVTR